jgi:hypothetical protein
VFHNNKVFLGIEKAHCVYYDVSRIDILLWKNLQEQGEGKHMFEKSVSLESFNLAFNSCSLFHYYCTKSYAIQVIFEMYQDKKLYGELTPTEELLPL